MDPGRGVSCNGLCCLLPECRIARCKTSFSASAVASRLYSCRLLAFLVALPPHTRHPTATGPPLHIEAFAPELRPELARSVAGISPGLKPKPSLRLSVSFIHANDISTLGRRNRIWYPDSLGLAIVVLPQWPKCCSWATASGCRSTSLRRARPHVSTTGKSTGGSRQVREAREAEPHRLGRVRVACVLS